MFCLKHGLCALCVTFVCVVFFYCISKSFLFLTYISTQIIVQSCICYTVLYWYTISFSYTGCHYIFYLLQYVDIHSYLLCILSHYCWRFCGPVPFLTPSLSYLGRLPVFNIRWRSHSVLVPQGYPMTFTSACIEDCPFIPIHFSFHPLIWKLSLLTITPRDTPPSRLPFLCNPQVL